MVDEPSGGHFVLVNEAVNLGMAMYNMRQGEGSRYETLFWDETVGSLAATNARECVRMPRRALNLGGFHQVTIRRSFGSWRTGFCQSMMGVLLWEIQKRLLLTSPISSTLSKPVDRQE